MVLGLIREKPAAYGDGSDKARIPERLLAQLWNKRAARQAWFKTKGGTRVRVIYPGRGGNTAGPDFRDALIEVEDVGLVREDVEIHLTQRDWDHHGHGRDPNYNGVVLHAALESEPNSPDATRLQSGRYAPVVTLEDLFEPVPPDLAGANPGAGSPLWELLAQRGHLKPEALEGLAPLLDRAGDQRFLAKSAYFQTALAQTALNEEDLARVFPDQILSDQVLYETLMEALGYRSNQQAFLKLATRAP